jgi:hydroxymethylpyrimidine pyrophosphatase-like HAD family hydrolase
MAFTEEVERELQAFAIESRFADEGGIITDLDGTAVHEVEGRIYIPREVELGLKKLLELDRPFVLNSLRFPLSMLWTFGQDWYNIANAPIPAVSMNGSQIGYLFQTPEGEMAFEETDAFPLTRVEIEEALVGVKGILDGGIKDILVFYYPRNWRMGEIVWTPVAEKVAAVREKYRSASSVSAVEFDKLKEQMLAEDICMIFLLIDVSEDRLMAYQHTKRSSFITHKGVDKLFGTQKMAEKLGIDLEHSLGAGDTELDIFLKGVGLAVHVGQHQLEYKGILRTIKLNTSNDLGNLLFRLAEMIVAGKVTTDETARV